MVLYSLKYGRRFLDEVLSSFKKISHLPSAYLQRNIYSRQLCHIEWEGIEWARELLFSGKYTGGSGIQKRWYTLADEITRTTMIICYAFAPSISSLCKLMEGFPQVLAVLCCCFWGNALFPKQTLPPFYSTLLLYLRRLPFYSSNRHFSSM